jgi:hypothetical protein
MVFAADASALAPNSTIRGADAFRETWWVSEGGSLPALAGTSGFNTSSGFASIGMRSGRGASMV